ncbi:MAG: MFS transporter [Thermodesulfobacteriota bacterium]
MKIRSTDNRFNHEGKPGQPPPLASSAATGGRSVQSYIDETPYWADGTTSSGALLTRMQRRIWGLATAGKFFEGMVVFLTGVALPLIQQEFGLTAAQKGLVSSMVLCGILIGATTLGGLADVFGRKRMFIVEMVIFTIFVILLTLSPSFFWLTVFLFGMGAALGCDYPTAHMVISESIPSRNRGRMVLSAFAFQAVGALVGTFVGYLILAGHPAIDAWRWMYATAVIPAVLVIIGRFFISDSSHWLVSRGRIQEAEHEIIKLLHREPPYPQKVRLADPWAASPEGREQEPKNGYGELFSKQNRRATLLASLPWFLQDVGTYGIGIFTPIILAETLGHQTVHVHNLSAIIHNDILGAKGVAMLDVLLLVGIIAAVLLADKAGRIRLQIIGFLGCAVGLALAALSMNYTGQAQMPLLFAGFMLFNFMTNLGPNAQTYLLAGEVFPTHIRGRGAGFAASFAKIGAVTTAFLFPILLKDLGTQTLLTILVGTSLAGALLTWVFRIETTGVNLEDIGKS